jgi:two-component system, NarL family, invasion response regulator UvrY
MQSTLSLKNVLIAEDHPLVLLGVKQALIEVFPDIEVTRADNFSKTLKAIENQEFDLLVLDINIPGGDKVEMITLIRQRAPTLPILVNSSYDESLYALPYLRAGANGFISKTASSEEFKAAVEAIITHRVYASPSVLQNAFGQVNHAGHKSSAINRLTDRELDIAKLLSNGLSTSQISATVNLSLPQ